MASSQPPNASTGLLPWYMTNLTRYSDRRICAVVQMCRQHTNQDVQLYRCVTTSDHWSRCRLHLYRCFAIPFRCLLVATAPILNEKNSSYLNHHRKGLAITRLNISRHKKNNRLFTKITAIMQMANPFDPPKPPGICLSLWFDYHLVMRSGSDRSRRVEKQKNNFVRRLSRTTGEGSEEKKKKKEYKLLALTLIITRID